MFMPSGAAAAAAGGGGLPYRIRAAKTLAGGGFDTSAGGTVPAGWTLVRTAAGRYTFTHDIDVATTGVAFVDTARTTYQPSGISTTRSSSASWTVQTNRGLEGGYVDCAFWIYAIEPLKEGAVQLAQVNGTNGTFVGTPPAGWTITRTSQGIYQLRVPDITNFSFQTGGHALFCTLLAGQDGRCINQTYAGSGATGYFRIEINRLFTDGAIFDGNFYITLLRADPDLIQGVQTLSSGGITGVNPGGFINSRTGVGLYTMNPNKGESADPRIGNWVPWMFGLSASANGAMCSMVPSANNVLVDTHRSFEGAAQDKVYGFQLIANALGDEPDENGSHTLVAAVFGPTYGFVNVNGQTPAGSFTPANSGGWPVGRLTYGGSANAVTFSFRGNRANDNNSWSSLQVSGVFASAGQAIKTLYRSGASFNGYNATSDETSWGLPEFTDSFISGRAYDVIIRDREPG